MNQDKIKEGFSKDILNELKQMSEQDFANNIQSVSFIKSSNSYHVELNVKIVSTKLNS